MSSSEGLKYRSVKMHLHCEVSLYVIRHFLVSCWSRDTQRKMLCNLAPTSLTLNLPGNFIYSVGCLFLSELFPLSVPPLSTTCPQPVAGTQCQKEAFFYP